MPHCEAWLLLLFEFLRLYYYNGKIFIFTVEKEIGTRVEIDPTETGEIEIEIGDTIEATEI